MECVNCSEELNNSILTSKARPWYCPACKHPNFLPETPDIQPSAVLNGSMPEFFTMAIEPHDPTNLSRPCSGRREIIVGGVLYHYIIKGCVSLVYRNSVTGEVGVWWEEWKPKWKMKLKPNDVKEIIEGI